MKPAPNDYEPDLAVWVVIGLLIWGGYLLIAGLPPESRERLIANIVSVFVPK